MKETRAWVALLAVILMLSACGQPEFIYVRDRDGTTYFKVPASFAQIDADPLETVFSGVRPDSQAARLREQRVWSTAFDQSPEPAFDHLFDSREPFVYATVHKLTEEQRATVSLDRLRDFILPVTEQMRTAYLTQALQTGRPPLFKRFEPISDQLILLDNGARGVRVRFNYQIGATTQTFDHTAILDEQGGTVSVMLITCQANCFTARGAEFDEIATSFKLLRLPG
ncbi:LptM family lipoprotein [Nonomuraea sp. LPB2021202275-12-8]|uniref:LptM family lipoprotein n=1 Tax=Nonomuraea sp. LPB2021202275-12-8 TaxID=3120159 RepID=UPI00300D9FC8